MQTLMTDKVTIQPQKLHQALTEIQALSGEACYRTHTHLNMHKSITKKCNKLHAQIKLLASYFYYLIACVGSRYVSILMLLLYRWLSLIQHRNQKGFLLSLVYKHLKGIFA